MGKARLQLWILSPYFPEGRAQMGAGPLAALGSAAGCFAHLPRGCITEVKHLFMFCWVSAFSASCLCPSLAHFSSELCLFLIDGQGFRFMMDSMSFVLLQMETIFSYSATCFFYFIQLVFGQEGSCNFNVLTTCFTLCVSWLRSPFYVQSHHDLSYISY